jgi:hypothetical protein
LGAQNGISNFDAISDQWSYPIHKATNEENSNVLYGFGVRNTSCTRVLRKFMGSLANRQLLGGQDANKTK